MAQPYVTGPVNWFVSAQLGGMQPSGSTAGTPGNAYKDGSPVFFGHTEGSPEIDIEPDWEQVFVDLKGSKKPYDFLYAGESALISGVFTRWNESVLSVMQARVAGTGGRRGHNGAADIGTLMLTEGFSYPMWMQFPFATLKPAMSTEPAGYHWFNVFLLGPDRLSSNGTRPRKVQLFWVAVSALSIPGSGSGDGGWSWDLYDHNMAAIQGIPIN